MLRDEYPADVVTDLDQYGLADHVRDGDLDVISSPIDLIGVTYYEDYVVAAGLGEVRETGDYPGTPIFITENGAADDDVVTDNGRVHDNERIAYYDGYLRAAHRAKNFVS